MGLLVQIVGVPFSGKTVSACTFPKPMKYLDFDVGFESVKTTKDAAGNLIVPDWEEIERITFTTLKPYPLTFKSANESDFKTGSFPEYTKESIPLLNKYNVLMEVLFSEEKGKTKTVVIDSASTMFRLWDEAIMFTNKIPAIRIGDYKTLNGILFGQFLANLKSLAAEKVDWVIVINHESLVEDKTTGIIQEIPVAPSNPMGKVLSRAFDEVWRQTIDGKDYIWRTRKVGFFTGAGSRLSLPDPIKPATYQELQKHLKGDK